MNRIVPLRVLHRVYVEMVLEILQVLECRRAPGPQTYMPDWNGCLYVFCAHLHLILLLTLLLLLLLHYLLLRMRMRELYVMDQTLRVRRLLPTTVPPTDRLVQSPLVRLLKVILQRKMVFKVEVAPQVEQTHISNRISTGRVFDRCRRCRTISLFGRFCAARSIRLRRQLPPLDRRLRRDPRCRHL